MTTAKPIATATPRFAPRLRSRWTIAICVAWAIALSVPALPAFFENLAAYRELSELGYHLTIGALLALTAVVFAYGKLRHLTSRYELPVLASALVLACFVKEPLASLAILVFGNTAFAIGRFLQERLSLSTQSAAAGVGLCGALGLGALILAMMTLGAVGAISIWSVAALMIVPCIVLRGSLKEFWRTLARSLNSWRSFSSEDHLLSSIMFLTVCIFAAFTVAVALTPTISADSIRYHLPSAIYYATTGSLAPVPELSGSHLPQAIELLMSACYLLGGQPAAQFINPLFLALFVAQSYSLTRLCGFGRTAGIVAAATGLSIPFVHWSGSVAKVDIAVAVFQLASLECFIRGRNTRNTNWLLTGLTFLALSAGAKLTAIYGAIPLALVHSYLFFRLVRERVRFRPAQIAALVLLVVVVAPFWQVRNYLEIGDPWYPMSTRFLTANSPPLAGTRPGPIESYFLYPWITHFQGKMSFKGPSNNPAGVFMILFLPVWLLVRRKQPNFAERTCAFFAVLSYLYWGFMWAFLRYGIPMFAVVCCLTSGRLVELKGQSRRGLAAAVNCSLLASLLFSITVTARYEINLPQLQYLAGMLSKRDFRAVANRNYAVLEKLGQVAEPGERTFSIDNTAVLYAPNPALFTYDDSMAGSPSAEKARGRILTRLRDRKYRYLVIPVELDQDYDRDLRQIYQRELLHQDSHYNLYGLSHE